MAAGNEKKWLVGAVVVWAIAMAAIIAVVFYFHRRSQEILISLVANDPNARRQAVLLRLEADRKVNEALLQHQQATSASLEARTSGTVLIAEVVPLLEEAERLYLESLDENSSQPGVLFHLSEVNSLLGRRARAARYLSRYWETQGEPEMARVFADQAVKLDSATTPSRFADQK